MSSAGACHRILILGGTGFVGLEVCRQAAALGWTVVAISRRGTPAAKNLQLSTSVEWVQGDATEAGTLERIMREKGPFNAVIHAVGALFDAESGLGALNRFISGAGSVPNKSHTYDDITRKTALALLSATEAACPAGTPFVFVSAAEAGWPDMTCGPTFETYVAPKWLKRYLAAKRIVEATLLQSSQVRAIILRPSFIWNWGKLDILLPVCLYNIAALFRAPLVDPPVRVETLAAAAIEAIQDSNQGGAKDSRAMGCLARASVSKKC